MAEGSPRLGAFGVTVVRSTMPGFVEKTLLGKPKLSVSKYLGAYTAVAGPGTLVGLRFRHAPLAAVKLVSSSGRASDLAGELRRQASDLASDFGRKDADFFEISMFRERGRLLGKLGVGEASRDPLATERYLNKATVGYEQAHANLVGCFARFLGLGLFEPEWVQRAYLHSMPDMFEADSQWMAEFVRSWVSDHEPTLLPEFFPGSRG